MDEVWHRSGSSDQVMSSLPRLTVRRCDLLTLKGLEWLNDEVFVHVWLHACGCLGGSCVGGWGGGCEREYVSTIA